MRNPFPASLLFVAMSVSASAAVDSGLLALVPSGSKIITGIDLQRARSSDFGQYLLRRINAEDQDFQQLAQQTGFDPRRDLQDLVFASAEPSVDRKNPQFAILARGNFDEDRIGAAAKAKGAVAQTYQEVELFVNASKHEQTAFAFPEVGVFVFGDIGTVQQIIANRSNPTTLDPALQQLVSGAGADNDAWFASLLGGNYLNHHVNSNATQTDRIPIQALQSITESSGGVRFGSEIQLSLSAITRSQKDAGALADVVRFLANMIQMQAQKPQMSQQANLLVPALSNMDVKIDGNSVHLAVSLPEKGLEQLADSGLGASAGRSRPTTR